MKMGNKVRKNIEFIKTHWIIFLFVSIILFYYYSIGC